MSVALSLVDIEREKAARTQRGLSVQTTVNSSNMPSHMVSPLKEKGKKMKEPDDEVCTVSLQLDQPTIEFKDVPVRLCKDMRSEQALKEWIWLNHKERIVDHLVVHYKQQQQSLFEEDGSDADECNGNVVVRHNHEEGKPRTSDDDTNDVVSSDGNASSKECPKSLAATKQGTLFPTGKNLDLLSTIVRVNRHFFQSQSPKVVFGFFLEALLDIMESEYGFIGEIKYDPDGTTMFLQTHAITNIAWDQASRQFYEDNIDQGFQFRN